MNFMVAAATVFLFFTQNTHAQPSITLADMPIVGTKHYVGMQESPLINIGAPANTAQTWNFTALQAQKGYDIEFLSPAGLAGETAFSNANLARVGDISSLLGLSLPLPIELPPSNAFYSKDTDGKVFLEGIHTLIDIPGIINLGEVDLKLNPHMLYYAPAMYGDTYSSPDTIKMDLTAPVPGIGDVQLAIRVLKDYTADAFGKVQLPDTVFNSSLRVHETNQVSASAGLLVFGIYQSLLDTAFVVYSDKYWVKDGGFPVAAVNYSEGEDDIVLLSAEYWSNQTVGIQNNLLGGAANDPNLLTLFPNPSTNGAVYMNLNDLNNNESYKVLIYNNLGQKISEATVNSAHKNMPLYLEKGMYKALLVDSKNNIVTQKSFVVLQ